MPSSMASTTLIIALIAVLLSLTLAGPPREAGKKCGVNTQCKKGLACKKDRSSNEKTCVELVNAGGACAGSNKMCKGNLVCSSVGIQVGEVCQRQLSPGKRCDKPNVVCKPPLSCLPDGAAGGKICAPMPMPGGPGDSCEDNGGLCLDGLVCTAKDGTSGIKKCKTRAYFQGKCFSENESIVCSEGGEACDTGQDMCLFIEGEYCFGTFDCLAPLQCVGNACVM